jgi:hypothetical protein
MCKFTSKSGFKPHPYKNGLSNRLRKQKVPNREQRKIKPKFLRKAGQKIMMFTQGLQSILPCTPSSLSGCGAVCVALKKKL